MKAYKYQIFSKTDQDYVSVKNKRIWFTLEDAVRNLLSIHRPWYPSDPNDYYEIHKIAVCEVCTIEP
jgi:hypothetical protein